MFKKIKELILGKTVTKVEAPYKVEAPIATPSIPVVVESKPAEVAVEVKTAAKKPVAKKVPAAKKPVVKKPAAKKPVAKKAPAKKTVKAKAQ